MIGYKQRTECVLQNCVVGGGYLRRPKTLWRGDNDATSEFPGVLPAVQDEEHYFRRRVCVRLRLKKVRVLETEVR